MLLHYCNHRVTLKIIEILSFLILLIIYTGKEETNLNNHDFNMGTVKQTELKIIEMVKCIKGELPLYGLVERIDDCLSLFNNEIQ